MFILYGSLRQRLTENFILATICPIFTFFFRSQDFKLIFMVNLKGKTINMNYWINIKFWQPHSGLDLYIFKLFVKFRIIFQRLCLIHSSMGFFFFPI